MRFSRRTDEEFEETDEQVQTAEPVVETDAEVQNETYVDTSTEADEPAASRWLRAIISLIVLALLLIGLFLGGRWIYNSLFNDESSVPAQISGPGTVPGGSNPVQPAKDKAKNDSSSTTATTTERSNNPAQSTSTPTVASTPITGGELPNSGPGSVLAIFVGASLVATGLHYALLQRRSAKHSV